MAGLIWSDGDAYEAYVGRWSRSVAGVFLGGLAVPAGLCWADVGCGTGVLSSVILRTTDPVRLVGVDRSEGFLRVARAVVADRRAGFCVADARSLPLADRAVDVAVSGLTLNFVPDPAWAVAEMARTVRPGGVAAAYVWDYVRGMGMMRHFWDAASELDPAAAERDEGRRTGVCEPDALRALWVGAGLRTVSVEPVDVPTVFADFDDYWSPLLGGQGSVPGYVRSLAEPARERLRDLLTRRLPVESDGSIRLTARAWTVRGAVRRGG